ncbi:hypothetical protein AJ78_00270 [Emergomyces pasteurianus Ep9510]|uniref:Uncharacterized protein n=1 Tax=Emergomyces pasteurianus Ep9510 TaxID=1447872 RepID=A0A1J9QHV5_9EURO|nr:hypothetical protein AJ78_00270 [Emergomyces pasteurianus Ep9510]
MTDASPAVFTPDTRVQFQDFTIGFGFLSWDNSTASTGIVGSLLVGDGGITNVTINEDSTVTWNHYSPLFGPGYFLMDQHGHLFYSFSGAPFPDLCVNTTLQAVAPPPVRALGSDGLS